MHIHHLYTGDDGNSHVELLELAMDPTKNGDKRSQRFGLDDGFFGLAEGQFSLERHNAPRLQLIVVLKGRYQFESSEGDRWIAAPGDIFLANDLVGTGHSSLELDGHGETLIVTLPADADLSTIFARPPAAAVGESK